MSVLQEAMNLTDINLILSEQEATGVSVNLAMRESSVPWKQMSVCQILASTAQTAQILSMDTRVAVGQVWSPTTFTFIMLH